MNDTGLYVSFRLAASDVSAIRFGISPGHELCQAVAALQAPETRPLLWGWLKQVRRAIPAKPFSLLAALIAPTGYFPDFLTSPPWPNMEPSDEVELLRTVAVEQVRLDLEKVLKVAQGDRALLVKRLADDPDGARHEIADAWWAVWTAALEPHWGQIHRVLMADIAHRSRRIAEDGLGQMIGSIHDRVGWKPGIVRVRMQSWSEDVDCGGSGLLLVPSLLGAPFCSVVTEHPAQPTLFYPAHGVTESWHRSGQELDFAIVALLGEGRASILQCLDGPRTTSDTAQLTGLAVSTASHHLSVLREARLISSTRDGARVFHARTVLGDALAR
jgi:hypothetical protein